MEQICIVNGFLHLEDRNMYIRLSSIIQIEYEILNLVIRLVLSTSPIIKHVIEVDGSFLCLDTCTIDAVSASEYNSILKFNENKIKEYCLEIIKKIIDN